MQMSNLLSTSRQGLRLEFWCIQARFASSMVIREAVYPLICNGLPMSTIKERSVHVLPSMARAMHIGLPPQEGQIAPLKTMAMMCR